MFQNWGKLNRIIYILGSIFILASNLLGGKLDLLQLVTLIGTLLGFLSVALIVNQKKQAGIVGLLSAICYIVVSFFAHNPSDMVLNICFIAVLDLPIIFDSTWNSNLKPVSIKENHKVLDNTFILWLVVFASLFCMEKFLLHSPRFFWSPLAGSLGIAASYLTVRKVKEAFVLWALQNFIQIVLWSITFLSGDAPITIAITYLFYLLNAGTSFFDDKWFGKITK